MRVTNYIKVQTSPFISNLEKLACASKQDVLELATLRYILGLYEKNDFMYLNIFPSLYIS